MHCHSAPTNDSRERRHEGYIGRKWLPVLGERRALAIALGAEGLSMLFYGLAPFGWLVFPIIVLGSVGGLAHPAMQGLMSRNVGEDEQGWIQGAFTGLSSLAGVIAPPVLTAIFGFFIADERPLKIPGAAFFFSVLLAAGALVVALGLDAHEDDPFRGMAISTGGFARIGALLGALRLPTVLVQEGGYLSASLGDNLASFLAGFRNRD